MQLQKEALISSNDSGVGGVHKKPRQPKQCVGVTSKVSSSEKEKISSNKIVKGKELINSIEEDFSSVKEKVSTASESTSKVSPQKEDDYCVIMKKGKNAKLPVKEKPKVEKVEKEKKKRTSMKEHIKAARNKPNPPMVF